MINMHCFQIRINGFFGGALCIYAQHEKDVDMVINEFCKKRNLKRDQIILKKVRPAREEEITRMKGLEFYACEIPPKTFYK